MQIEDYIKVFNVVPKDICELIIKDHEHAPDWEQHSWYNALTDATGPYHNKELDTIYRPFEMLPRYVEESIKNYYKETGLKGLVSYHSNIRLNRYKTGRVMSEHVDLIRRSKEDGIPVLTVLGLLNDNFVGGEFVMNGKVVDLKQGDVIVFPSTFMYSHRVNEVIEGTRYSFVTWAY